MFPFRLEINPGVPPVKINHRDGLLTAGSCFSESIAAKLSSYHFQVISNPFGILYNPLSLTGAIERILSQKEFKEDDLVFHNGLWHSPAHHGSFSGTRKEAVLAGINAPLQPAYQMLAKGQWLIITLGSAYGWFFRQTGKVAGNCHKMPASLFAKRLISSGITVNTFGSLFEKLLALNPALQIILTVSPVKYIRDGITENTLSKSHLIISCHELAARFREVHYFPSFELVNDDLRDYRFYKEDLVHPNEQAVEYVWNKFSGSWMDQETVELMKDLEPWLKRKGHKIMGEGPEADKFAKATNEMAASLAGKYPWLDSKLK